jgi:ATP-dependent DNA helicase RecG
MSREERRRVFDDFKHRRFDVLLTTTLIEDSPAIPNATAMVLEQADRYDLLRLHRLRAHVSRGIRTGQVLCVHSDQPAAEGLERVELISREEDGFRIAEHDLIERGAETLLGERAAVIPEFRYVRPLEHQGLLVQARAEAFSLLERDPNISRGENRILRLALERSWERWFEGELQLDATGRGRGGGRERSDGRRRRRRRGRR